MIAVGILYPASALVTFFLNKRWTFKRRGGRISAELVRFVISHVIAYFSNLYLLHLFANQLGYPYQIVQLALIVLISVFLFLMFKFFVLGTHEDDEK